MRQKASMVKIFATRNGHKGSGPGHANAWRNRNVEGTAFRVYLSSAAAYAHL